MMFYDGDLQSGIALAVQEAKSVICFVRDDAEESAQWDKEYFDEEISQLVKDNAVALRLTAGSQEAGFLTSLCPINTFPTAVVIKHGMLQEYIVAGTSKDDFQKRLKAVLVRNPSNLAAPVPPTSVPSTPQNPAADTTSSPAETSNSPPVANAHVQFDTHAQSQPQDTERRDRESTRAGKRPVQASEETATGADRSKRDLQEWRGHQRKLEQQRKEERERVLNQIKQDKEARRRREAEEKARHTAETKASRSSATKSQEYRLQVRLFDGSSVRSSFPPSATVRSTIRPWLDEQRSDGNQPYTLKHVLTPLPSPTISVAEEEKTLEELGLGPTANLVMIPVQSYTEAYASSSSSSLPVRAVSAGYSLVSSVVGSVAGTVGSFLGYGPAGAASSNTPPVTGGNNNWSQQSANNTKQSRPTSSSPGINIRTFRDQRDEQDENQFYNGNRLNFEPRRDDDRKND